MAGSELGPGLVVSLSLALANSRDQSSAAAHPGPLCLSLVSPLSFFKVWISPEEILLWKQSPTETSLCKSCELKKV